MSEILAKKDDLVAFRAAIRDWLKKVCPPADFIDEMEEAAGKDYAKYEKYQRDWMAELTKVGLAVPHWPAEYGGASLSLKHLVIVADEMARAGAPRLNMYVISLNHIPATLLAWANDKQKPSTCRAFRKRARRGVRASRSPAPAPTSLRCAPRRNWSATST
jgi:alkylation response protein AidB-like acyl-CoA dehydrogenase